jgi:hypothetical protein
MGCSEVREATALNGAILLLNPKAYLIIALMFTQFLPASGADDPALIVWITTVFTLNNRLAFTICTRAGDLLTRRFRSAFGARLMNSFFVGMLADVAVWMRLRRLQPEDHGDLAKRRVQWLPARAPCAIMVTAAPSHISDSAPTKMLRRRQAACAVKPHRSIPLSPSDGSGPRLY